VKQQKNKQPERKQSTKKQLIKGVEVVNKRRT
jgi:hypothetical protein